MARIFLMLLLATATQLALGNDRVDLDLNGLQIVMGDQARRHMQSDGGMPVVALPPVELNWAGGNAVLPNSKAVRVGLNIRFVPEASMSLEPTNHLTLLSGVSGRLVVYTDGLATSWRIEQANYGNFFAKSHWFLDEEASVWRFGLHLPVAFLRESDGHRIVGHMFIAFSDSNGQLTFVNAWINPRLGGKPPKAQDSPAALFTRAVGGSASNAMPRRGEPSLSPQSFSIEIASLETSDANVFFADQTTYKKLVKPTQLGLAECGAPAHGAGQIATASESSTSDGPASMVIGFQFTPGPSVGHGGRVWNFLESFRGTLKLGGHGNDAEYFQVAQMHRGNSLSYSVFDSTTQRLVLKVPIGLYAREGAPVIATADMTISCLSTFENKLSCGMAQLSGVTTETRLTSLPKVRSDLARTTESGLYQPFKSGSGNRDAPSHVEWPAITLGGADQGCEILCPRCDEQPNSCNTCKLVCTTSGGCDHFVGTTKCCVGTFRCACRNCPLPD